jgi:tetraacyldisaccharide 4'-kinase
MKLYKPKFWSKKYSFISLLLLPFTLLIICFIFCKKKLTRSKRFNVPIICVGNIYVGGTGKTPTSIFIAKKLLESGKNPVIVKKFYKSHSDEHQLIRENFKNFITNKNRIEGIEKAETNKFDTIILDDGLQDYRITKNLKIVCFNQKQLIGNGLVFPSGPLRETLGSLTDANIILINGKKNNDFEKKILNINKNLDIFYSIYKPTNIEQLRNKNLLAIAGIGNPNNFFQLLEENNLTIKEKITYPDHYEFTSDDVSSLEKLAHDKNYQIITTEKNYYKIMEFGSNKIKYLKIILEIIDQERFIKLIKNI